MNEGKETTGKVKIIERKLKRKGSKQISKKAEESEESVDSFGFKKLNKLANTPVEKHKLERKEKKLLYEIEQMLQGNMVEEDESEPQKLKTDNAGFKYIDEPMDFDQADVEAAQTEEENTDKVNKRRDFVEKPRKYKGKSIYGVGDGNSGSTSQDEEDVEMEDQGEVAKQEDDKQIEETESEGLSEE